MGVETLSDVTYRSHDTRTELTNLSDPGPYAKPPRPKVAANAVMDFDNNNNHTQTRTTSAITTTVKPRKFLDLRISNKSLLVLNATLESTVKEQTDKIATMPSFEVMMETQQKQSEYLNKVEELINTLSTRMNEHENEIKVMIRQIVLKT
ncbi:15077_t:CDS:2 [Entrophospora sp. SA101]|nr:15077_t:CDS:2 [Entrophospora sp. SA101]